MLHTDSRILPERQWIWASWNYLIPKKMKNRAVLTYDMNILQTLQASRESCVTLNGSDAIDPAAVKASFIYHHPVFTTRAPEVQKRHAEISGIHRTHFCGAYCGGSQTHEDRSSASCRANILFRSR